MKRDLLKHSRDKPARVQGVFGQHSEGRGGSLGCPVLHQELDSKILMGLIDLKIFYKLCCQQCISL